MLTTAALQSRGSVPRVLGIVPFTISLCVSHFWQLNEPSHVTTILMCVGWICRVFGNMGRTPGKQLEYKAP